MTDTAKEEANCPLNRQPSTNNTMKVRIFKHHWSSW